MIRIVYITSLVLNLALGSWLILTYAKSKPTPLSTSSELVVIRTNIMERIGDAGPEPEPPSTEAETEAFSSFRWSEIESTDFNEYAENLRRIGCPEQTVRRILIPEIIHRYEKPGIASYLRYLNDRGRIGFTVNPDWLRYSVRNDSTDPSDPSYSEFNGLYRGARELVQHMFATDIEAEPNMFSGDVQWSLASSRPSFLPDEVRKVLRDYEQDKENLSSGKGIAEGMTEEEIDELRSQIKMRKDRTLQSLVLPDDYDEYLLRNSPHAKIPRNAYGITLNEEEMRAIVRFHNEAVSDQPPELTDDRIRALLGNDRFEDYQMSLTRKYRSFHQVASFHELPESVVEEAYGLRVSLEQEAARFRNADDTPTEHQQAGLEALRDEVRLEYIRLFGEDGFRSYLVLDGAWIRRLGH